MKLRYYIFTLHWLYHNRAWDETRQKYKALRRDWEIEADKLSRRKGAK